MGRSKQTTLQSTHTNGQKAHEKMPNITNYQRNSNVKTTMRYHLTSVRMANIRKSIKNKCWRRCGEKGTFLHCWWKCKLGKPLWRTAQRFLKKLKVELPYDPEIPLRFFSGENTNFVRYMHPSVHSSTIYNFQDMEATLISINRGMVKVMIHIYNGRLLSHKKK